MFTQFIFKGSNPYITKTNTELFRIVCKYYVEQFDNNSFVVCGVRGCDGDRQTREDEIRAYKKHWALPM